MNQFELSQHHDALAAHTTADKSLCRSITSNDFLLVANNNRMQTAQANHGLINAGFLPNIELDRTTLKSVTQPKKVSRERQDCSWRAFCDKPIKSLDVSDDLADGLAEAKRKLNAGEGAVGDQISLGVQVGTIEGVYGVGNGAIALANTALSPPMRLGNFLANIIKEPDLAIQDAANLGSETGKTISAVTKNVLTVDRYLDQESRAEWRGDFGKPLRDASSELAKLRSDVDRLNPGQQANLFSAVAVDFVVPCAAGKALTGANFAEQMQSKIDGFIAKSDAVRERYGIVPKALPKESKLATQLEPAYAGAARQITSHTEPFEKPDQVLMMKGDSELLKGTRRYETVDGRLRRTDLGKVREPYNWRAINEKFSSKALRQSDNQSCISAVGEMLSAGKLSEHWLMERLGVPGNIMTLHRQLGPQWVSRLDQISFPEGSWAAELLENAWTESPKSLHVVVVDGVNAAGNVVIRDPWEGTTYEMTENDFRHIWTTRAVCRKSL